MAFACYAVALFWSYYYLSVDEQYSKLPEDALTTSLLIPSMLGGFPIIYLHNMYVRAESDLLAPFIGMLQYARVDHQAYVQYFEAFCKVRSTAIDSYMGLYKDPYSLPIDRPNLPSAVLRNAILPSLKHIVNNESVLELFAAVDSPESKMCIKALDSANVVSAKVFSNIVAALPIGLLDELLRKFESSRSVNELLILRHGFCRTQRILRRVVNAERKLQNWRYKILNLDLDIRATKSFLGLIRPCPAQSSYLIRQFAWGKSIEGLTMPPLQHQVSFTTQLLSGSNTHALNNHFTYYVHPITQTLSKNNRMHYSTSNQRPFIGYTTRAGTVEQWRLDRRSLL